MPYEELKKQKYLQDNLADAISHFLIPDVPCFSPQKNSKMCLKLVLAHLKGVLLQLCHHKLVIDNMKLPKYMEGVQSFGVVRES